MIRAPSPARMLSMLSRSALVQSGPAPHTVRGALSTSRKASRGAFSSATRWSAPFAMHFPAGREQGCTTLIPTAIVQGQQWRAHSHGHSHGHSHDHDGPSVKLKFVYQKDNKEVVVDAPIGMNLLRVAQAHEVELEGACECSLACSTCHVVLEDELFDSLEEPTDDENDMLDLAFGLTETSRLGCQIIVTEEMEGASFKIPTATRNMYVDGHVPKPH